MSRASRDFDANRLLILASLLEHESVTRSARELGLTQPATSNALAKLREDFGDPLLVKSAQGMRATRLGARLKEPLQRLRGLIEELTSVAAEFDPPSFRGTFRIGALDYAELLVLPRLTQVLSALAPNARLHVDRLRVSELAADLAAGRFDVALVASGDVSLAERLYKQRLVEEELVCVTKRETRLPKPLELEHYLSLRHVLVDTGSAAPNSVERALNKLGARRQIALTMTSFSAALHVAVASNLAVTLPRRMAELAGGAARWRIDPLPFQVAPLSMHQVWHARVHADPQTKFLRRCIHHAANPSAGV